MGEAGLGHWQAPGMLRPTFAINRRQSLAKVVAGLHPPQTGDPSDGQLVGRLTQ
jgi:hypothetical protein